MFKQLESQKRRMKQVQGKPGVFHRSSTLARLLPLQTLPPLSESLPTGNFPRLPAAQDGADRVFKLQSVDCFGISSSPGSALL